MVKLIRFLRGYLYVSLTGYAPERFLNLCSHRDLLLWNLRKTEQGYTFCISLPAFWQLKPALKKSGTRIRILGRYGLPFFMHKYRKHIFFIPGIVLGLALTIALTQFIWTVDISGNLGCTDQMILKYLKDEGIGYGSAKRSINCKEIQTMLRRQFDEISWVSARLSGTKLYLEIQEQINPGQDPMMQEEEPADLVADCDGIVVSIMTREGVPQVEEGDEVKKGDLLVSGAIPVHNDGGEVVSQNFVRSDADVWIETSLPYEDTFANYRYIYRPVGSSRFGFGIRFPKTDVVFSPVLTRKEEWILTEEILDPVLGSSFSLPFPVIVQHWEKVEKQRAALSETEIQEIKEQHFLHYCEKLAENSIQILSNSVIIKQGKNDVTVQGTLHAVQKADEFVPVRENENQEGINTNGIDTADDGNSD